MSNKLRLTQISSFFLLAFIFVIFGCTPVVEYGDGSLDSAITDYKDRKKNLESNLEKQTEDFGTLKDATTTESTTGEVDIDDFKARWDNLKNEYSYLQEDLSKIDKIFKVRVDTLLEQASKMKNNDYRDAKIRKIKQSQIVFGRRMIEHKKRSDAIAKLLEFGDDYVIAFNIDKALESSSEDINRLDALYENSQDILASLTELSKEGEKIALDDVFVF